MSVKAVIKTKYANDVFLIEKNARKFDKTVLIIGVFHGDEIQGEFLINKFLKSPAIIKKNRLLLIPCLNPDGKENKTRQNANKIDLNRNFPTKNWEKINKNDYYGGNEPESEIETKFLVKLLNEEKIDCILTIHSPYKVVNFDGPAKNIAQKISEITGYPVQADIGYPTPGSFGTYCGIERKIPIITLELDENLDNNDLWEQNKQIFEYFANEF